MEAEVGKLHFELVNIIEKEMSRYKNVRGNVVGCEQVYNSLAKTLLHQKIMMEFKRKYDSVFGETICIPDMNSSIPTESTDAVLLEHNRNARGKLEIGSKSFKLQFKRNEPTQYGTVGLSKYQFNKYKQERDLLIIFAIPNSSHPKYHNPYRKILNLKCPNCQGMYTKTIQVVRDDWENPESKSTDDHTFFMWTMETNFDSQNINKHFSTTNTHPSFVFIHPSDMIDLCRVKQGDTRLSNFSEFKNCFRGEVKP